MRANQRSRTAEWIAAMRAAHLRYDRPVIFEDPLAIHLTSRGWRWIVDHPPLYRLVVRATGLARARGAILARARYTEDRLEAAVRSGIGQYVIVGAGLDSFAWRRRDLAGKLMVLELDHPASQLAKRQRLARSGFPIPQNLELIPVDLGQSSVAAALGRSGYRREARGFFSLLGTVQYLPREAVTATLRSIADVAAVGSELVLSYIQPREAFEPAQRSAFDRMLRFAARQGEPFMSLLDPDSFPAEVCALGYRLVENASPREQAASYFAGRTDDLEPSSLLLAYLAHFRVGR